MNIKIDKSVERFIETLENPTIAKVLRTFELLEEFGSKLGPPYTKKVAKNIFELRIRGQQEIRIFYVFKNSEVILFHAFRKKSRKIPSSEIEKAERKLKSIDNI